MKQQDRRKLEGLLTELISAQDDVTHWSEAGAEYTEKTREMIVIRANIEEQVRSLVYSLVKGERG